LKEELRKAYAIAPDGIIGVNVMVALSDFEALVRASLEGGAKIIICGAGLPMTLPELTSHAPDVALVPIVSSVRAAQLIAKKWHRGSGRLPDAVVVEDPETAGGHLGEKIENIGTGRYDHYKTVREVKEFFKTEYDCDIPVIAAGGIWDRADLLHALEQGADGVQMASRFCCHGGVRCLGQFQESLSRLPQRGYWPHHEPCRPSRQSAGGKFAGHRGL